MAALVPRRLAGVRFGSRSSSAGEGSAPAASPHDELRSALKHFYRALKTASPQLRPASEFPLSDAVTQVIEAVKNAPRTEHLGRREAKAVRRAFAKGRSRLAQAVAVAQRSGDLGAAQHALEAAALFGEAVTALQFIEVEEQSWTLTGRQVRGVLPILWRGRVVDSVALEALAEATLQMEIPPLLAALQEGPTSIDLAELIDRPYFLGQAGFDLLARAQGRDLSLGKKALLLQRGRMARIAALLTEVTADGRAGMDGVPRSPAAIDALVACGDELCSRSSNVLPQETAALRDLLRRVRPDRTSRRAP